MRIVTLGLALALGGMHLNAASYYVDYASGSDWNPGDIKAPWKHCPGDPAATDFVAGVSLAPGDTVYFKGGVSYVLTGASGIALNWDGASGSPIVYDGNSAGVWGTGRAKFTDNHGGNGLTAFASSAARSHLRFRALEFSAIGGSALLPDNLGSPVDPRHGGGIAFRGGGEEISIEGCVFRDLGYSFAAKPMSAVSVAGAGISSHGGRALRIIDCEFFRVANGCDFSSSGAFSEIEIARCTFGEGIVWPLNLPATAGSAEMITSAVRDSTFANDSRYAHELWSGFGPAPRTEVIAVQAGAAVTLLASAVSAAATTFEWRKNGVPMPGATAATLRLASVSAADAAVYTVRATNAGGSTVSNAAVLTVSGSTDSSPLAAPLFQQHPAEQTVAAGSSVTFSIAASGNPLPVFQWFKNGSPIGGATASVLTLSGVTSLDSAVYTVTASNSAGTTLSKAGQLTVYIPAPDAVAPSFEMQPSDVASAPKGTATFSAQVVAIPAPTYQWLKDGTPLAGGTTASLTLTDLTSNDLGTYTLVVTNSAGTVTSRAASLTFNTPPPALPPPSPTYFAPVIVEQPLDQTGFPWGSVTFSALATGYPAPSYQWLKNGVPIAGWTNPSLTLDGLSTNDVAVFTLVATNPAGSATSRSATLTLSSPVAEPAKIEYSAPIILVPPASQFATTYSSITFTAVVTGAPAPTLQWLKNGVPVGGWTNASLTLVGLTSNDVAEYVLVATNPAGTVSTEPVTIYLK